MQVLFSFSRRVCTVVSVLRLKRFVTNCSDKKSVAGEGRGQFKGLIKAWGTSGCKSPLRKDQQEKRIVALTHRVVGTASRSVCDENFLRWTLTSLWLSTLEPIVFWMRTAHCKTVGLPWERWVWKTSLTYLNNNSHDKEIGSYQWRRQCLCNVAPQKFLV